MCAHTRASVCLSVLSLLAGGISTLTLQGCLDPALMEATQIPKIDAVQEPDNVYIYDHSPKHQITDPGVISKR